MGAKKRSQGARQRAAKRRTFTSPDPDKGCGIPALSESSIAAQARHIADRCRALGTGMADDVAETLDFIADAIAHPTPANDARLARLAELGEAYLARSPRLVRSM